MEGNTVNRMLSIIFGCKREVVIGGWRKLHSQELHNLLISSSVDRIAKWRTWAGHVERIVKTRKKGKGIVVPVLN
jgi:hypothetical protein